MQDKNNPNNNEQRTSDSPSKADPETLHTTDPQEHMEGPLSSAMSGISHAFESDKTPKEADEERDRNM